MKKLFEAHYAGVIINVWMVAVISATIQGVFIALLGPTPIAVLLSGVVALLQIGVMIYLVGSEWPGKEDEWTWSNFWAGLFNLSYIGYERPGIGQVPFTLLALAGFTIGFLVMVNEAQLSPLTGIHLGTGEIFTGALIMALIYPIMGMVAYGIGYLFGGKREA